MPFISRQQLFMDREKGETVGLFIYFPTPVFEAAATYDLLNKQLDMKTPEYLESRCQGNCPNKQNTAPMALCPDSGRTWRFSKSYLDCNGWIYTLWYNAGYGWRTIRMNPKSPLMKEELAILSPCTSYDEAQGLLNRYARLMCWPEHHGKIA